MSPAIRRSVQRRTLAVWLAAALLTANAWSADPAALIPADAMAYFGWSRLIEPAGPNVTHGRAFVAALRDQYAKTPDDDLANLATAVEIGLELAAGTVGGAILDLSPGPGREPRLSAVAVLSDLRDAAELQQRIVKLIEESGEELQTASIGGATWQTVRLPDSEDALHVGKVGDKLVFAIGEKAATGAAKLIAGGGASLASDDRFQAVRTLAAKYVKEERIGAFVDFRRVKSTLLTLAKASGEQIPPQLEPALEESGINALRTYYWRHAHAGQTADGVAVAHTDPGVTKGLLKVARTKPLEPALYSLIPGDAYWAGIAAFDWAEVWAETRRIIEAVEPDAGPQVDAMLNGAKQMVGFSITDDLMPMLGREWMIYDAPAHGSFIFSGAVGVVHPKDATALHDMLLRFVQMATPLAQQGDVDIKQLAIRDGKQEIHYLMAAGVPVPVAPAWTTVGDRVVFGLFPQTVAAAARRMLAASPSESIAAQPDVKEALAGWPKGLTALGYFDVKEVSREFHGLYALATTAITSFAGKHGAKIDFAWLPPLPDWHPAVKNLVIAKWHDENAIYAGYHGNLMLGSALAVALPALGTSVALPSLAKAREQAKTTVSMSNLRGIAQACHIYSNDHAGKFPPDLNTLVTLGMATPALLNSPLDWDRERTSYVFIGRSVNDNPADVILYEATIHGEYLVAFVDGHVERLDEFDFVQRLRATYERQGRTSDLPPEFRPMEETPAPAEDGQP